MTKRTESAQRELPPATLEEGEAWCDNCRHVIYQLGPWQDICPCGASLARSGYDEDEIAKREQPPKYRK